MRQATRATRMPGTSKQCNQVCRSQIDRGCLPFGRPTARLCHTHRKREFFESEVVGIASATSTPHHPTRRPTSAQLAGRSQPFSCRPTTMQRALLHRALSCTAGANISLSNDPSADGCRPSRNSELVRAEGGCHERHQSSTKVRDGDEAMRGRKEKHPGVISTRRDRLTFRRPLSSGQTCNAMSAMNSAF